MRRHFLIRIYHSSSFILTPTANTLVSLRLLLLLQVLLKLFDVGFRINQLLLLRRRVTVALHVYIIMVMVVSSPSFMRLLLLLRSLCLDHLLEFG